MLGGLVSAVKVKDLERPRDGQRCDLLGGEPRLDSQKLRNRIVILQFPYVHAVFVSG